MMLYIDVFSDDNMVIYVYIFVLFKQIFVPDFVRNVKEVKDDCGCECNQKHWSN